MSYAEWHRAECDRLLRELKEEIALDLADRARVEEPPTKGHPLFNTAKFWKETAERALKTFAQSAVAMISANAISVTELDWEQIAGIGATAAVISVLTSIASAGSGPEDSPSLV